MIEAPELAIAGRDEEAGNALLDSGVQRARGGLGLLFWFSAGWIVTVVLLAILAPVLPLQNPEMSDFLAVKQAPSSEHWFGTDAIGRDIFSRALWGTRVSVIVGVLAVAVGMSIGTTLGLIAGFRRGRVDSLVMTLSDSLLAFPALVLLLSLTLFLGKSVGAIAIGIGVITTPTFIRLARAKTMQLANREYVLAARAMGARTRRVLACEILPNVIVAIFAFALIVGAVAISAEGALSFLGLSVPEITPTWGNMIAAGQQDLIDAPHMVFVPAGFLFATTLALNFVSDRLRQTFDRREQRT